jgi:hypothetical protein
MGPVILARGLEGRVPYAVKVHGSALKYTVRPHRKRFLPYALEGIRGGVLVGSRYTVVRPMPSFFYRWARAARI